MRQWTKQYYHLKTNQGKTEFIFDIDDLKKSGQEGDLKSRDFKGFDEKPHLVKLLKKIQDEEDGYI